MVVGMFITKHHIPNDSSTIDCVSFDVESSKTLVTYELCVVPHIHHCLVSLCVYTYMLYINKDYYGKSSCKTSFQAGMDLQNLQKQGRDEIMQEDYPTTE